MLAINSSRMQGAEVHCMPLSDYLVNTCIIKLLSSFTYFLEQHRDASKYLTCISISSQLISISSTTRGLYTQYMHIYIYVCKPTRPLCITYTVLACRNKDVQKSHVHSLIFPLKKTQLTYFKCKVYIILTFTSVLLFFRVVIID